MGTVSVSGLLLWGTVHIFDAALSPFFGGWKASSFSGQPPELLRAKKRKKAALRKFAVPDESFGRPKAGQRLAAAGRRAQRLALRICPFRGRGW